MAICGEKEVHVEKNEFFRQVSAQLGKLDYRKLYSAYSGTIRKSQVEPRILFEIILCAYMKGVYSSRKIEELCRENMQFILLLDGHKPPDHCTIARFRSGEDTAPAIEDLFYQYAMILEREGLTNHSEVFIDGTKIESKANRYTFVWRKCVERQLAKIKAAAKGMLGLEEGYVEFAPQLPKNQAIADNRSIEQRICIKPAKRSRQRDLSLLVRFMQRRATPITQKDVSRR